MLAVFFPAGSSVSARAVQPNPPPLDRRLPARVERVYEQLSKAFSPGRAMDVVTVMSQSWRLPGNPAFDASEDSISRGLAEAGFRMVGSAVDAVQGDGKTIGSQWYEEFPGNTPAWEPVSATVQILDANGDAGIALDMARPLDRVSLCINSFSTPADGVRAPLVFVGRGLDAGDYAGVDVRGKIVFGDADARRLFDMAVRQRGALGVMSTAAAPYTRPDETPDVVQWSGIPYDETLHAFGFKISRRLAARFKERLAAGATSLKADIATRFRPRPNRTLVAEIRGRARPGERVVLMAHVQEPGANDNASGCATLVEMVRALATGIARGVIPPPARSLTFLWGRSSRARRSRPRPTPRPRSHASRRSSPPGRSGTWRRCSRCSPCRPMRRVVR